MAVVVPRNDDSYSQVADEEGTGTVDETTFLKEVTLKARPLTILDISMHWQRVAFDAAMALFIGVPGLGIFCLIYIFFQYSWLKRHLLFGSKFSICQEVLLWYVTIAGAVGDLNAYYTYVSSIRQNKVGLAVVLELVQVDLVSTACYVGSVFLGRILTITIIEISAHVNFHKARAEKTLSAKAKAKEGLDELHEQFVNQYKASNKKEFLPSHRSELHHKLTMISTRLDKGVTLLSSICIALGLLWMKLSSVSLAYSEMHNDPNSHEGVFLVSFLGVQVPLVLLVSCVLGAWQASASWYNMMSIVLGSVSLIDRNVEQLLLFTAMPKQTNPELWDQKNRDSLKKVLKAEDETPDDKLVDLLAKQLRIRFDLTKLEDISLWWSLRKYIQVDFLDESTIMDYCSCISIMLLLTFITSGSLDWMVHADARAPGLILSIILAAVSVYVVAKVLQASIEINTLLDRDAQVLLDAEESILSAAASDKTTDHQDAVALLRTISRKIEMFDDKLQVLGITVTANVRNTWVASMMALLIDASMKALKPLIANLDIEDVEAFIQGEMTFPDLIKQFTVRRTD